VLCRFVFQPVLEGASLSVQLSFDSSIAAAEAAPWASI
jgi:hypothetical protein